MVEITGPEGDLCAGLAHPFEASGADACLTIRWIIVGAPAGVSDDDIIFSAPNSLVTNITVPIEGSYQFAVECCEPA